MEITWIGFLIIVLLVSPALSFYAPIRLGFPLARSNPQSEFRSLLGIALLSTLLNLEYILYIIFFYGEIHLQHCCQVQSIEYDLFYSLKATFSSNSSFANFGYFLSPFINSVRTEGIVKFFINLQIRSFVFGAILTIFFKTLFLTDDFFGSGRGVRFFRIILGYEFKYKPIVGRWFERLIAKFKVEMHNYWNVTLSFNHKREICLLDVYTDDDNLYQGALVDWIPSSEGDLHAINIWKVIRYYPQAQNSNEEIEDPDFKKSNRKFRFISTSGEMIILASRIRTIHIHLIKKNTSFKQYIHDTNSEELFKWYLSLLDMRPDIFSIMEFKFLGDDEKYEGFLRRTANWIKDNNLSVLDSDKLSIQQFSKDPIQQSLNLT